MKPAKTHLTIIAASVGLMSACASSVELAPVPMPSTEEVARYVTTHWAKYAERAARFQRRRGQIPSLIAVTGVSCAEYYGHPDCSFTVTISFADENPVDQRLQSTFERGPDGALNEVILSVHERVR